MTSSKIGPIERRICGTAVARAIVFAAAMLLLGCAQAAAARPPNPIQSENALPGTTSWQARAGGDIELYGSQIGAAPGDEVDLHVSTANRYRLDVYRLGWYGGAGARRVACLPGCNADEQGRAQSTPTLSVLPVYLAPPL